MPSATLISRGLPVCHCAFQTLRGRFAHVLALGTLWFGLAPLVLGSQLQAAAGLQEREAATHELAAARKEVLAAQAATRHTRNALDEFLAGHLDAQREAATESEKDAAQRQQSLKLRGELESQLAELRGERLTLLETLTDEHPEVVDVTVRIEAVEARLKATEAAESDGSNGKPGTATLDATEYQRLLQAWRTAERRLESARLAESAAADRLAALSQLMLHSPAAPGDERAPAATVAAPALDRQQKAVQPGHDHEDATAAVAVTAPDEQASRTQTLALASLALAVMLAALAAVRLARATADPLFSSADEVAAALAVPVVGIVPFGAKSAATGDEGMRRGLLLLGQVVLALALFSAVAYVVVHFDAVLRLLGDPIGTLRSWFSF